MAAYFNSLPVIKKGLRYGVIYVVTSLRRMNMMNEVSSEWMSSHLLKWLESLTGFEIEVIDSPDAYGTTLMARRFNVGNAGKDAVVQMPLVSESLRDIKRFADSVTDVLSTEKGDQILEPEEYVEPRCSRRIDREYGDYYESSSGTPDRSRRKRAWMNWIPSLKKHEEVTADAEMSIPSDIELEEEEILSFEQQKEAALKAIQAQIIDYVTKFQADPSQLIHTLLEGKIVISDQQQQSPLVVNNDFKIVLPNYNEVEVKMPAMCRTIYILFLKHPEGIALRDIADHRADLEDIYSMVKPGRSEEKAKEAIENLIDPMSNTLNEYISKIKRCFKTCILDDDLANQYCITGKRGEPYSIALDPALITLPRAVAE